MRRLQGSAAVQADCRTTANGGWIRQNGVHERSVDAMKHFGAVVRHDAKASGFAADAFVALREASACG